MPLFDRYCSDCETFEEDLLEPSPNTGPEECPHCGRDTFERIQHYPSSFQILGYSFKSGYSK